MISNNHYIALYINDELVDLESQESLGIRINNVIFNPTQVSTTSGEYSYSFKIPSTPNNDKILNHANILAKTNKFHVRYPAQVYADGDLIFNGSLTVKKFNAKEKEYECNLVNIKVNTLDEIFKDDVLTDMSWYVPFEGASTINQVNSATTSNYWFPFVSYGAFAKNQVSFDESSEYADYTSKFTIDSTNTFYLEDFYPSLNVVETMKKCFESKGYTVGGNIFNDKYLNNIYASVSLAEGQDPIYNVGNPKFGKLDVNISLDPLSGSNLNHQHVQDLNWKYFPCAYALSNGKPTNFNFEEIAVTNILRWATYNTKSNMLQGDGIHSDYYIEIPADGFYRISLSGTCSLRQSSSLVAEQTGGKLYVAPMHTGFDIFDPQEWEVEIPVDMMRTMPFEIQLNKGLDPQIELIKGKWNLEMMYPDVKVDKVRDTVNYQEYNNKKNTINCFPHEPFGRDWKPAQSPYETWTKSSICNYDKVADWNSTRANTPNGYHNGNNDVMCYDPVVSDAFICGFSTMGNDIGGGTTAFIKDGWSWSKTYTVKNNAFYNQLGYMTDSTINPRSNVNYNFLVGAPNGYCSIGWRTVSAKINGMVELKKGDILTLNLIKRVYRNSSGDLLNYDVKINNLNLGIEAVTDQSYELLKRQMNIGDFGWTTPTRFPSQLNLFNFTNKEKKVSEWLTNIKDAFNLSFEMNGNNVDINTNQGIKKDIMTAVDIDDRVNSDEAESEMISYPKEMSVQYRIDTEEHGFYNSVPTEYIDREDWKKFGESGFTVIQLNDDSYVTQTQNKTTQYSYTWYDTFRLDYSIYGGEGGTDIRIPVIEKEEYMIDKVNDQEAMAHRGYQLPQRFFFRTFTPIKSSTDANLWIDVWNNPSTSTRTTPHDYFVYLYAPVNEWEGINLSYKDSEKSLLTEYFNVFPMLSSNFVTVETFLNPNEYIQLKGGSLVHFDDDLYYISEISGFDPSGSNKTKLKMVKKT